MVKKTTEIIKINPDATYLPYFLYGYQEHASFLVWPKIKTVQLLQCYI